MRTSMLVPAWLLLMASPALGQAVQLTYGFDRNVEAGGADMDGSLSAVVEWDVRPGLAVGLGTDHHFEGASPAPADHLGWALFVSASRRFEAGPLRPYLRGGLGLGRAPCEGDVCTSGAYLRASAGTSVRVRGPVELSAEVALSRVSRPIAGIGVSIRPTG